MGRSRQAALLLVGLPAAASGANIALWSQTSPDYHRALGPTTGRASWAVWPPDVARDLRYHVAFNCPSEMRPLLKRVFRQACDVWESAADLKFVPVSASSEARLRVFLRHDGQPGAVYHGAGSSWPPRRDASGALLQTDVHIGYAGDHIASQNWRDDAWVWVAVHELGHALGLWHEFQRPDRERCLRVDPDEQLLPFLPGESGDTAGTTFDVVSVMMYAWTDGDRGGRFVLVAPETGAPLPTVNYYQRNGLSPGDVAAVRLLYGPPRTPAETVIHVPPGESDEPLRRLRQAGWRIVAHPGARIHGVGDAVVFEAEQGLWDHWTLGGNPPRIKRAAGGDRFQVEVDVDARYVPAASFAGLFIGLSPNDWISFGAWEHPRQLAVQRTGAAPSPPARVDSSAYRLIADYRDGTLRLAFEVEGRRHQVAQLDGLPRPVELAFGTRSWPGAEFSYRLVRFANANFRPSAEQPE